GNLSGLSPSAFRIFGRMALSVRDHDDDDGEEGLYYGGWYLLCPGLGFGGVNSKGGKAHPAELRIQRGTREVSGAGYITVAPDRYTKKYGHRVYRLNIARIPIV